MAKLFKVLGIILVALIVLAAIAIFVVANNLGSIIKTAVNDQGPNYLGVPVSVNDVDINVLAGSANLSQLAIANPAGFSHADSFSLNAINLELDLKSLQTDVIVIKDFSIDGASILAEQVGSKINLQVLKERVSQQLASINKSSNQPNNESAPAPKIAIEKFSFTNAQAMVKAEKIDDQQVSIPNLVLNDIGTPEQGITIENATKAIMDPLMKSVIDQVKKEALGNLAKEALQKELDKALDSDKAKNKLKNLFDKL